MTKEQNNIELTEDIEVVGPGAMLAEARRALGLSQKQVAEKLNFRSVLVNAIENENFDDNVPSTFTKGYLRNYAKLVEVPVEDVLNAYDHLGIVEQHTSKMQSFSKQTKKQAENKLLMAFTYLIITGMVGLTVVWGIQESKFSIDLSSTQETKAQPKTQVNSEPDVDSLSIKPLSGEPQQQDTLEQETPEQEPIEQSFTEQAPETAELVNGLAIDDGQSLTATQEGNVSQEVTDAEPEYQSLEQQLQTQLSNADDEQTLESVSPVNDEDELLTTGEPVSTETAVSDTAENSLSDELNANATEGAVQVIEPELAEPVDVSFWFSGDCWVNIYDATGNRIAWGVKKTDYNMNITGVPPFQITLGKPELVTIEFDSIPIDISHFKRGHIAKFELPLVE